MGVTYTKANVRDAQRARRRRVNIGWADGTLVAASLLCVAMVAAAAAGRFLTLDPPAGGEAVANLNRLSDARSLEPVLAPLFTAAPDGRLAARELFNFLVQSDSARRALPNVGAIARARVSADTIDHLPAAASFRARLADERVRATTAKRPAPTSITVLTASQLAGIKPQLVVRDAGAVKQAVLLWTLLFIAAFHALSLFWRWRGLAGDRVLLTIVHLLAGIGFVVMISRPDPLRDQLLFIRYAQGVIAGTLVAGLCSLVNVRLAVLRELSFVPLLGAFVLSVALILFGSGPTGSNAKVNLGPLQPIEAIRVLLALFLAGYFARRWELLRSIRGSAIGSVTLPSWLNVPRARYALPMLVGVGAALTLFALQKDLGPALMLALVFLTAYGVARGTAGMMLLGLVLLGAGFYLGYRLDISATLADRVRMWQSPWDNGARGGDQIANALWAMATGGLWGSGLGLGDTRYVPAGHTDLVLASVTEDLGSLGFLAVALLYVALTWRALSIARRATTDYGFFLALILTMFFAVPVMLVTAGLLGVMPLTGVVTPFLSFGGSAMIANFAALGLLASIASDTAPAADLAAFSRPLRIVGAALACVAVVLVTLAARVAVWQADELAVRPHLGVQADGARRYQYNPRVLDVARAIPRGSVLDRHGLPLATDDRAKLTEAEAAYARLGISLRSACSDPATRCYPLGGRGFHLLGDAVSRVNWSASNTSFVERDSEATLRGFNDHQSAVRVSDVDGDEGWAIRRDYHDLLPLLRHRHDPSNAAWKTFLERPHDVTLTIDARLQLSVTEILAKYAARSATGRAAAVVIDPDTGDLLASASVPWPSSLKTLQQPGGGASPNDALLDRARYGLYPPGSTFKLVTAAAALLRDAGASRTTFVCSRLKDGRVGAKLPGVTRPIRDDVLDTTPHGEIDMHQGLVVSCNAYFAQLASRLGTAAMLDAAQRVEVPLARGNAPSRIRDTLPQIGYGQGDVVASPERMARIVAAIAAGGIMRATRVDSGAPSPAAHEFVPPGPARQLAGFMRDVVLSGTGRSLRSNPVPIAGKTGTAELTGAPSHAWFVGFAPYGEPAHRIAFAVVIENAGYGGTAAAPVAGEIVTAAAALGLAR